MLMTKILQSEGTHAWHAIQLRRLAIVALPAVAVLLLELWPLIIIGALPFEYDMMFKYYPAAALEHLTLTSGALPLWNPFQSGGAPFLADPGVGALYPVNLIFDTIASASLSIRLNIVFHVLLTYLGMYLLLRAIGVGRGGSIFGAISYAFSGYIVYQLNWPNILPSIALFPFILLMIERAYQAPTFRRAIRWATGAGIAFGLLLLSGAPQYAFYAGLVIAGNILSIMLRPPSRYLLTTWWRSFADTLLIGLIMLGVGAGLFAVQLLPSLDFLAVTNYSMNYVGNVAGGLQFDDLGALLFGYSPEIWDAPRLSVCLLVLAFCAIPYRPTRHVVFHGVTAVISLLLAFQLPENVTTVLLKIPGFEQFLTHNPERIAFVTVFSLSVLAGIGVDRVFAEKASPARRRATIAVAFGVVAVVLAAPFVTGLVQIGQNLRFLAIFASTFAVIAFPFRRRSQLPLAQICLVGIAIVDSAVIFSLYGVVFRDLDAHFRSSATAAFVQHQSQVNPGRVLGIDPTLPWAGYDSLTASPDLITGNSAWVYGLEDVQGYNPLHLQRYWEYLDAINRGIPVEYHLGSAQNVTSALLKYLDVRYLIYPAGTDEIDTVFAQGLDLSRDRPTWSRSYTDEGSVDRLEIVSTLANSVGIAQGQAVAVITVEASDGTRYELPFRAGIDSAEWSYDKPSVKSVIKHQRAPVATSSDTGFGFDAHTYISTLRLPRPVVIRSLEMRLVPAPDAQEHSVSIIQIRAPEAIDQFADRITTDGGYNVWRLTNALPRAMLVPTVEISTSDAGALQRMQDTSFDPRRRVLFSERPPANLPVVQVGAPDVADPSRGSAHIDRYEPDRIEITTSAPTSEVLVLGDNYYPAWRATVDGQPATVYRVNYMFQGVVVPAGQHNVTMYYQDDALWLGAAVSFLTLVAGILIILRLER